MRVNLPLLYDQPPAGIRNEADGLARTPEAVIGVYDAAWQRDPRGFPKEVKINEQKNHRRNSNFPGFGSFLAGASTKRRLPKPMPG